jgi:two-component system, LytTR family, sensor kinase
MTIQEFILSKQKEHRRTRHVTFWALYALLFYAQGLVGQKNTYFVSMISVFCYVPTVVMTAYVFTLLLGPLLQQKNYVRFLFGFVTLIAAILMLNSVTTLFFFHFTCDCSLSTVKNGALIALTSINSTHAVLAGGMIFGYKIGKEWFLKQLENRQLEKQKIDHQVQLQKARLYPAFLFQSLNSLYERIQMASPEAPEIILKLSDLLSYLLYESDNEWVVLEKEVTMINNLVALENVNRSGHVSIQCEVNSSSSKVIQPLVIFPVLHDCFDLMAKGKEQLNVDLQLITTEHQLNLVVLIAHNAEYGVPKLYDLVSDVRRRLNYLHKKSADVTIAGFPLGTKLQLSVLLMDGLVTPGKV